MLQSSSEVSGYKRAWEWRRTCSLQDSINGVGVLEHPTCRKLVGLLAREAKTGEKGVWGFATVWRAKRMGCTVVWVITHL